MSECIRISIIIPVFNAEKLIEKALKSLIDQHYANLEIIIIDGGSKDKTVEVLQKYQPYITYLKSEPDNGPNDAINKGIALATGEFIGILMSDDWYEPNTLNAINEAYHLHPDTDIISCGGKIVYFDQNMQRYITTLKYTTSAQLALNFYNICFGHSALCCRFISKNIYNTLGNFKLHNQQGKNYLTSDKEWFLRTSLHQTKNIIINHMGHNYLAHSGSSTFNKEKQNIMQIYSEHMDIAKEYLANKNLTKKQQNILINWYFDNSIRLSLRTLSNNFSKGIKLLWHGFQEGKMRWISAFITTLLTILKKKIYGGL